MPKDHCFHTSGQSEWYTNTVDDRSVQVGGQQKIPLMDIQRLCIWNS